MIGSSIKLHDAIGTPPWSIVVQFFCEIFDEHSQGPIIVVGQEKRPVDVTFSIYRCNHGDPWPYEHNRLRNRVSASSPCFSDEITFSEYCLIYINDSDFILEQLDHFSSKSLTQYHRSK